MRSGVVRPRHVRAMPLAVAHALYYGHTIPPRAQCKYHKYTLTTTQPQERATNAFDSACRLRIKLSDVELDSIGVEQAILQRQTSFNKTLLAAGAATRLDAFHGQITPHFLQSGYAGVKHHRSLRTVNTRACNSQGSDGRAREVRCRQRKGGEDRTCITDDTPAAAAAEDFSQFEGCFEGGLVLMRW